MYFVIGFMILVAAIPVMNFLSKPASLGLEDGKLTECPNSPNCVSTQTDQTTKQMASLKYSGDSEEAMQRLREILKSMPRTRIVSRTNVYLHVEVRSLWMRYADDVEFLIDEEQKQIHFRSASRVGHSDLGVNRNRMQDISDQFQKLPF